MDPSTESEIASFKIPRILFCTRGGVDSAERNCFAFTCSHGDNTEMFQCHVFRCDLSDAVSVGVVSSCVNALITPKIVLVGYFVVVCFSNSGDIK